MGAVDAMLAAFAIAAVAFWAACVPRVFRFDEKGLDIGFYLRPRHRLAWAELTEWRRSPLWLRLAFGRRRFAIFTGAYPARLMDQLMALLARVRPGAR